MGVQGWTLNLHSPCGVMAMRTLDLSAWSQQQLMYLLIATFLAIILLIVALLIYLRRTRFQPPHADEGEMAPPPEIVLRRRGWAGRMEIVVGGRTYRRIKDVSDPAVRRALMLAAGDLVAFMEPAAAPAPSPKPAPAPEHEAPATGKHYAPAQELAQQAFLAQLEAANLSTPPSAGWLAMLGRGLGSRALGGTAGPFVDDIERIIQRRCREQGIDVPVHLRTDGQGIVRVEVDGILYDSPGDIPDMAIRELIRAAVGEWEAHF